MRYAIGPYDTVWVENLIADITAGITVALTLIPQGSVNNILAVNDAIETLSIQKGKN